MNTQTHSQIHGVESAVFEADAWARLPQRQVSQGMDLLQLELPGR